MGVLRSAVALRVLALSLGTAGAAAALVFRPPAPATAAGSLEDLEWLAGYWVGEQDGVATEELWLPPRGGLMLGLHRDVAGSGTPFFEYLRIESGPEGAVYLASPRGSPPTPFRLTSRSGTRVVFENAEHDFPRRILYWLDSGGALHARVEGERDGAPAAREWVWRRAALAREGGA